MCSAYLPIINNAVPVAPATAASCVSFASESPGYLRATAFSYASEAIQGRAYRAIDVTQPWQASGRVSREYLDAAGRVVFVRDSYQNYSQILRDTLGRETGLVRFAGAVGSSPSVSYTRQYDLRGRVWQEGDDSSGTKIFSYQASGEPTGFQQAAVGSYGASPSGVTFIIGSLGRVIEQDRYRLVKDPATCAWKQVQTSDRYQYDRPYDNSSYGVTGRSPGNC